MEKIIFEEHLYFGVHDSFVTVCNDLGSKDKVRLSVYDSNHNELCSHIASTKDNFYEEDYARILANSHGILDEGSFIKIGYKFKLSCGVIVECVVCGDRVSIYSETEHKVANTPFVDVEGLKKYVCKNFGSVKSNDITEKDMQYIVC